MLRRDDLLLRLAEFCRVDISPMGQGTEFGIQAWPAFIERTAVANSFHCQQGDAWRKSTTSTSLRCVRRITSLMRVSRSRGSSPIRAISRSLPRCRRLVAADPNKAARQTADRSNTGASSSLSRRSSVGMDSVAVTSSEEYSSSLRLDLPCDRTNPAQQGQGRR